MYPQYQNGPPHHNYPPPLFVQERQPSVGVGPWSTGLFDCRDDYNSCCLTFWCPCITFGRIAEVVEGGSIACGVSGTLYILLMAVVGGACCYSSFYRSKLRQQNLLEGEPYYDFFIHCLCEECALCQEYRELENRGYDLSLGWEKNVERHRRMMATTQPEVQWGMKR